MANISSGIAGATTGAGLGSPFGPIGTGIGAVAGGLAGLFGSKRKKKKARNISTFDPEQRRLYEQQMSSLRGQGPFSDLYNFDANSANSNFDMNVSRPAYRNFQENIIPNITGQFRKGNIFNSSYTGEALSRAGRDVQEGLDAQRSNMIYAGQQDALKRKQSAIDNLLQTQTFARKESGVRKPSTIDQILNSVGPNAAQALADYFNSGTTSTAGTMKPGNMAPRGVASATSIY